MTERLLLDGKLDLSAAATLQTRLHGLLGGPLVLDAAQVTHLGALCTQILVAAARKARTNGHLFNIVNTSDRVLGQLAAMGLSPEFIAEGNR